MRRLDPDEVYAEVLRPRRWGSPGERAARSSSTATPRLLARGHRGPARSRGSSTPRPSQGHAHLVPDRRHASGRRCWPASAARRPGTPSTGRGCDVWWGDERFVPDGDPERNDDRRRAALLDHVPLDPAAGPPDAHASDRTATTSRRPPTATPPSWPPRAAPRTATASRPSTCCCSASARTPTWRRCSPRTRRIHETERTVIAVHGSPKPPPTRVSLTMPALSLGPRGVGRRGRRGEGRRRTPGARRARRPAAGAGRRPREGQRRTLFLVDERSRAPRPADARPATGSPAP